MNDTLPEGVTFLICTYNGELRLPETLRHLAAQQNTSNIPWEVVLVSNASTDNTLIVAPRLWAELGQPAPLHLFSELKPGKENALICGFEKASYESMCIVDDDNLLYPDYLVQVAAIMGAHPTIGILGGCAEGAFEVEPPVWFSRFQAVYAVGPQAQKEGPLVAPGSYLYGAGSVVRRSAWQHLRKNNFTFTTSTKRGKIIVSGEDVELGDAMRLAGYELWYSPLLRLHHFMYKERLTWEYLLRIGQGTALSSLTSTVYYILHREPALELAGFRRRYRRWLLWTMRELLRTPGRLLSYRRYLQDPNHPEAFDTMRMHLRLQTGWQRRSEAEVIFTHAKDLQRRLKANPAPLHSHHA